MHQPKPCDKGFDNESHLSKKLPCVPSERVVLPYLGTKALFALPASSPSNSSSYTLNSCHSELLRGPATVFWIFFFFLERFGLGRIEGHLYLCTCSTIYRQYLRPHNLNNSYLSFKTLTSQHTKNMSESSARAPLLLLQIHIG